MCGYIIGVRTVLLAGVVMDPPKAPKPARRGTDPEKAKARKKRWMDNPANRAKRNKLRREAYRNRISRQLEGA
jgi:hypothetical protein